MKWTRWTILIMVVLIALMTVTATACSSKAANEPPSITSLVAVPTSVAPVGSSIVTCVAADPDGDALSYTWTFTGGSMSGTGDTITWVAPSAANTYTVKVSVNDGKGGVANSSVAIVVFTPTPTPTPTPSPTPSDGSIDIKSNILPPAGAEVIIDGIDTGSITPYVATHISAGNHTVKLECPNYKWRTGTITVVGGETTYINWALEWATPQSVTLQPDAAAGKDAYTYETIPGNNYDGTMDLFADASAIGTQTKAYIQFDLAALPSTAVITSAWLELYYDYTSAAVPASIGAYRVIGTWTESGPSGITWNNQPAIAAAAEDTVVVPAAVTNNFLFWNIGNLVQSWVDGSVANRGVALADTDLTTAEAWKGFSSSDNGVAAQNPKLEINYYDPATP